ncbi:MAG: thioredoxin family protein [Planctomycetota bacterium]
MSSNILRVLALLSLTVAGCMPSFAPRLVDPKDIGLSADAMGEREIVVLKFGADWCPPCRAVDRSLDELQSSHGATVLVKKIDVDRQPDLANQFGVSSIPRILLLKDFKVVDDITGSRSHQDLANWVESCGAVPGAITTGETHVNTVGADESSDVTPVDLTPRQDSKEDSPVEIHRNPFA